MSDTELTAINEYRIKKLMMLYIGSPYLAINNFETRIYWELLEG